VLKVKLPVGFEGTVTLQPPPTPIFADRITPALKTTGKQLPFAGLLGANEHFSSLERATVVPAQPSGPHWHAEHSRLST